MAIENAKEVIYIEDWWLSPELFLRRPPYFHQEFRLDQTIKRAAERGVKIYVIVYKEVSQALTCNSAHTKHALRRLCPEGQPGHGNIYVLRHPDHNVFENMGDMTFYWAHHEKFMVIDYHLGFIGGLDMCYGRWDMRQHLLADVHPSGVQNEVFPGQDFNNNRIMDFQTVQDWANNELNKTEFGRMPWHDVAMAGVGEFVVDIAEHFVLRWNHLKRDKYKRDEGVPWLCLKTRANKDGTNPDEDLIAIQRPKYPVGGYVEHPFSEINWSQLQNQGSVHAQIVRSSDDWSSGVLNDHSIQNAYSEVIEKAQHFVYIENQFFITATGEDQAPIHNTIGRSIVRACVRAGQEKRKFRVIIVIPAIPGFAGDLRDDAALGTRAIMDYQYKSINRGENSIYGQIKKAGFDPKEYIFAFNLRAYDRINKTPGLIQQEKDSGVTYQELQRAEAEEIMGSGVHGFDEEREEKGSKGHNAGPSINSDEQQKVIDRKRQFEASRKKLDVEDPVHSSDSIAEDAMARGGTVSEEAWEGEPEDEKINFVQEELYIHAKLLIADDQVVICGSSNLNDRSQLGSHDSELSIVMQDKRTMDSLMDGQPYKAGYHAASLRRHLWREHLGLIEAQELDASKDPNAQPPTVAMNEEYSGEEWEFVADPLGDKLWDLWTKQATVNTQQYRYLFRADPDDGIKTWHDYDVFAPRKTIKQGHLQDPYMPSKQVREELDKIRGHLVWMPLEFLQDVNMAEKGLTMNSYTEVSVFVPVRELIMLTCRFRVSTRNANAGDE